MTKQYQSNTYDPEKGRFEKFNQASDPVVVGHKYPRCGTCKHDSVDQPSPSIYPFRTGVRKERMMERPERRVFITSDDLAELDERDRERLGLVPLLNVWDALQKGYLRDVPKIS